MKSIVLVLVAIYLFIGVSLNEYYNNGKFDGMGLVTQLFWPVLLIICLIMWLKEKRKEAKTITIPHTLDAQDAINLLVDELLGESYYIVDPVCNRQANAIIVEDILKKHTTKNIHRLSYTEHLTKEEKGENNNGKI